MGFCFTSKQLPYFFQQLPYYANLVSSFASIIGASLLIFFFFYYKPSIAARKQPQRTLVFFLAIADLIASASIFISQLWTFINLSTYSMAVCYTLRCLIQFGVMSSFIWTCCISVFLLRTVYQKKETRVQITIYHLLAWGIPSIVVVIILTTGELYQDSKEKWQVINHDQLNLDSPLVF